DQVELFDLEDLPPTHRKDLLQLVRDLEQAGARTTQERCARFPEINRPLSPAKARREVRRRSADWSQVRPEWGLSGNAAFIIGRRALTRGINLDGRVFLHSYDYRLDPDGRLLEVVMTGPQVVGQWINMEHYFSTVDPEVYGSGSKIYHNVVGRLGIMSGPQSDLRTGLAWQTVMSGERPYHEPIRLLTLIEAPKERVTRIIENHRVLKHFYDNEWVRLIAVDPENQSCDFYAPKRGWKPITLECSSVELVCMKGG
ncbi:MAG TPA: putative inorganic carbon transporter subunit DabA, partial [Methylomirabilota bacterium]|nr:putative inorganic carbon transporter subunit DabA [Methylomirabilota bacterium]